MLGVRGVSPQTTRSAIRAIQQNIRGTRVIHHEMSNDSSKDGSSIVFEDIRCNHLASVHRCPNFLSIFTEQTFPSFLSPRTTDSLMKLRRQRSSTNECKGSFVLVHIDPALP